MYDWTVPVTPKTEPAQIQAMQDRLVEWGWLEDLMKNPEAYKPGELDEATLQAVTAFQTYYNTTVQDVLLPIDPEKIEIAPDTLALLMVENPKPEQMILNPEMQ